MQNWILFDSIINSFATASVSYGKSKSLHFKNKQQSKRQCQWHAVEAVGLTHICLLFSPLNWKDIVLAAVIMEKQMFA